MEDFWNDGLFRYLAADSTLQSLLPYTGAGTSAKYALFEEMAPQDPPATRVVFSLDDDSPQYHAGGQCAGRPIRFTIDIYGESLPAAKAVRDRIYALLSGYRAADMGVVYVDHIHLEGVSNRIDRPVFGEEKGLADITMNFKGMIAGTPPDPMA